MTRIPKVVADTNVFVNGWFYQSRDSEGVLLLSDDQKIKLLFSMDTIGELMYIIKKFANKFMPEPAALTVLSKTSHVFYYGKSVNTRLTKVDPSNDPYDDMLYKLAIEGGADYLVTDDVSSGLHSRSDDNLKIFTTKEFIEHWETENP